MLNMKNNWKEIKPIEEGTLSKALIQGKAKVDEGFVYYEGTPVHIDGKYFINESKVIAYE